MPGELTRWKRGQSGNPTGRPRTKFLTEFLVQALQEPWADGRPAYHHLLEQLILQAHQGNSTLAKEIFERVEGKMPATEPEPAFSLSELTEEAEREANEYRPDERPAKEDQGDSGVA
jgi:hypothetical protein